MTKREVRSVPARAPLGDQIGYSRAVRVGDLIEVSGCTATAPDGSSVAPGDPAAQTRYAIDTIMRGALHELGGRLEDVIRTRLYLTDMSTWLDAAHVHGELFGAIKPASSIVGVAALVAPEYLVEVEATALVAPRVDQAKADGR